MKTLYLSRKQAKELAAELEFCAAIRDSRQRNKYQGVRLTYADSLETEMDKSKVMKHIEINESLVDEYVK